MRAASDNLRAALSGLDDAPSGSFNKWYSADLYYDGERVLADLPIGDVKITDDDSRAVKSVGSCTLTWVDDYGRSVAPVDVGDMFAPFGSELAVYAIVQVGTLLERVPMGWYQIVDVPQMRDQTMLFAGRYRITENTVLQLTLQDRFIQIQRDEFDVPSAPSQLDSVYREIANVTGLQITRSLPDSPINVSVAYQSDRMQAVLDLADIIGGVPYAAPDGTLSLRPKLWPAPVDTLRRGDKGTIVDVGKGMSADQVYNTVVFRGQNEAQDQVLARAEILTGPLRVRNIDGSRSPAHRRPTFRSNSFVTTAEQAQAYVESELVRVSTIKAVQWPITELWNPLRELGDVYNLIDEHDTQVLVRVVAIDRDEGPTQKVTVTRG